MPNASPQFAAATRQVLDHHLGAFAQGVATAAQAREILSLS